jgi:hypothetical protein
MVTNFVTLTLRLHFDRLSVAQDCALEPVLSEVEAALGAEGFEVSKGDSR